MPHESEQCRTLSARQGEAGEKLEPFEEVTVEVSDQYSGAIVEVSRPPATDTRPTTCMA